MMTMPLLVIRSDDVGKSSQIPEKR